MAPPPKLTTYRFRVSIGDAEDPQEFRVLAVGRDIQAAEQLFMQRGWGRTDSRPMTSAAVVAWAALTRTKKYTGDFDQFEGEYLEVVPEDAVAATPTEAAPDPA